MAQADIRIHDYGESIYAQAATRAGCDWLVDNLGAHDIPGFTGVFGLGFAVCCASPICPNATTPMTNTPQTRHKNTIRFTHPPSHND